MAPRRKTVAEKDLEGTDRGDRRAASPPRYRAAPPPMPKCITGAAAVEWKRVVKLMHEQRLLAETDLAALVTYCVLYAEFVSLTERMAKGEKFEVEGDGETVSKYPLLKALLDVALRLQKAWTDLGLSPVARSKVTPIVDEGEKENALQALQRRKAERAAAAVRPN